jgi:hypothetical protein
VSDRATRWTWLAYVYAALVACVLGYGLLGMPVQVSDSLNNIIQASGGSLSGLVYNNFYQSGYLRPFLWGLIRVVFDLSGGHYFEWFRGWHVAQVVVLLGLFVALLRVRHAAQAAVVPLGLAALVGIHTFSGTIREAFPINTFMTILLCCYAAVWLAMGPPRWWRDVAAALLLVFSALTVESGLLVGVIVVAAWLAGARGVSRVGVAAQVALFAGYFVLRFAVLDVGAPSLSERASGFGFGVIERDALAARFGGNPLPFYAYNVGASLLSLLASEPTGGTFRVTQRLLTDEWSVLNVVSVASSLLGTALIAAFVWSRRREWLARRFTSDDQLVAIFAAVAAANAVLCYAYTKDVILSPAGAFFAVALAVGATYVLESVTGASGRQQAAAVMLLLVLSGAWAFRAVGIHVGLRTSAAALRNDWAYVDDWLAREHRVPTDPRAIALKNHLQHDAIRRHPARPAVTGGWVEWFGEN